MIFIAHCIWPVPLFTKSVAVRKNYLFDRETKTHLFEQGDQVLALLHIVGSLFQMSERDYLARPNRRKRVQWCHVNLLKPYQSVHSSSEVKGNSLSADNLALESVRVYSQSWGLAFRRF